MLNSLNPPSLETRRKVLKLSLLYTIVNNLAVFLEAPNLLYSIVCYPYSTHYMHELSFVTFYGYIHPSIFTLLLLHLLP